VKVGEGFPDMENPTPFGLRRAASELEAKVDSLAAARPRLVAAIQDAIRNVARAKAAEIRKQAEPLRKAYDAHVARTAELLKALQEHAGLPHVANLMPVPNGFAFSPGELRPLEPKSRKMELEIRALLDQADAIEQKRDACRAGRSGVRRNQSG
jgi:hypothetical protein